MKKYILILLAFLSCTAYAQTYSKLPDGALAWGNQLYYVPSTGLYIGGNAGLGYKVVALKSYVDGLISLGYKKTQVDSLLAFKASLVQLALKQDNIVATSSADYYRGDKTMQPVLGLPISTATQTALDLKATVSALSSHTSNVSNPHNVTKAQVGLSNVDNTSDANKPISTATQAAITTNSVAISTEITRALAVEALKANSADIKNALTLTQTEVPVSTYTNLTYANQTVGVTYVNSNGGTPVVSKLTFSSLGVLTFPITTTANFVAVISGTTNPIDVNTSIATYNLAASKAPSTVLANRIDRYSKKLRGLSRLQLGIVDFSDIGVTISNPYSLKFSYDGALTWALKKVDANFNQAWKEGGEYYVDQSTGDRYESISVAKMNDPSLMPNCISYYVNYTTGVDDTSHGLTESAPFKRLSYALARAVANANTGGIYVGQPANIFIKQDWIGNDSGISSFTVPDGIKIKITGSPTSSQERTRLQDMRESYTNALFAWSSIGSGTYACSSGSINNATKNTAMCFDVLNRDADGAPTPLKYIAPQADEAATIALIKATPSSFGSFLNGGTTTMYVHLIDGRQPNVDNWVWSEAGVQVNFSIGEGSIVYIENIERISTTESINLSQLRGRPINVPGSYLAHTGQFWLYNCGVYGSAGQGFQLYDMQYGGVEWCVFKYNREDGENIHSFNTAAYSPNTMGSYMNIYSFCTIAEKLGENYFKNMPALGLSVNVNSAHDAINYIALNSYGGYTNGTPYADVNGAQTLRINCHAFFPTQADGLQPPGSGSPASGYWVDSNGASTYTKMILIGCTGIVKRYQKQFCVTNNGIIQHYMHGIDTSFIPIVSGTITAIADKN